MSDSVITGDYWVCGLCGAHRSIVRDAMVFRGPVGGTLTAICAGCAATPLPDGHTQGPIWAGGRAEVHSGMRIEID